MPGSTTINASKYNTRSISRLQYHIPSSSRNRHFRSRRRAHCRTYCGPRVRGTQQHNSTRPLFLGSGIEPVRRRSWLYFCSQRTSRSSRSQGWCIGRSSIASSICWQLGLPLGHSLLARATKNRGTKNTGSNSLQTCQSSPLSCGMPTSIFGLASLFKKIGELGVGNSKPFFG